NYDLLIKKLQQLANSSKKILLLGVSYALLDLVESHEFELPNMIIMETGGFELPNMIIMETGGMKGRRKEMIREDLHKQLCQGFAVDVIHSEYGMTELLSQAYSKGNGVFSCPPWMKILIRDSGAINIIDLANLYSVSFLATQDLGKKWENGDFEVLGRFDNSDIRGCNLLVM
ncbi:MAG: acyl transferase, partial [Bacteroidetes bacterium 4572_77]